MRVHASATRRALPDSRAEWASARVAPSSASRARCRIKPRGKEQWRFVRGLGPPRPRQRQTPRRLGELMRKDRHLRTDTHGHPRQRARSSDFRGRSSESTPPEDLPLRRGWAQAPWTKQPQCVPDAAAWPHSAPAQRVSWPTRGQRSEKIVLGARATIANLSFLGFFRMAWGSHGRWPLRLRTPPTHAADASPSRTPSIASRARIADQRRRSVFFKIGRMDRRHAPGKKRY